MSVVVFVWCMVEHFDESCHVVEVFEVWMWGAYPALTQKLHHPGVGQRVEITAQQKLKKIKAHMWIQSSWMKNCFKMECRKVDLNILDIAVVTDYDFLQ